MVGGCDFVVRPVYPAASNVLPPQGAGIVGASRGVMVGKIVRAIKNPQIIVNVITWQLLTWRIAVHNRLLRPGPSPLGPTSDLPELEEIRERMRLDTDISDHLPRLFVEALTARPGLIVELGVRGGDSTFVLERVAKLSGAEWISVDMNDCSDASRWPKWNFVQSDDITFAAEFPDYCGRKGIVPVIDVLFIDTSHLFDHTVQELASWFPYLSRNARVLFHDTNQRRLGRRADGRLMAGIDNRGVIAALERYFDCTFDANHDFITVRDGWVIRHVALSNGFTVLERPPLRKPEK